MKNIYKIKILKKSDDLDYEYDINLTNIDTLSYYKLSGTIIDPISFQPSKNIYFVIIANENNSIKIKMNYPNAEILKISNVDYEIKKNEFNKNILIEEECSLDKLRILGGLYDRV